MMMKRLIAVMALLAAAGCGSSSSTAPTATSSAPYSQQDLVVGTGTTANAGNTITVGYTGWLYDSSKSDGKGLAFDSSPSATFALSGLIAGWTRGIPGMKVGGTRRLIIPPDLAYGAAGRPPQIPPNATLVFDITLLGVQ
jgi:FKBP-type peptidyl-prolyl cis-trans isomerase FkpA